MATPATLLNDELPVIAIVGRVNVGKSALFNKLIEDQKALVSDIPGTTRTNNEGVVTWRGKHMRLIDTGGLTFNRETLFEEDIKAQGEHALSLADCILFVTDATVGIMKEERQLAQLLRKKAKVPIILVANKAETETIELAVTSGDWNALGFGEPITISSVNGRNTGDLLDRIYGILQKGSRRPKIKPTMAESTPIKISIIGKPNVGKSSLFNRLIGEERAIVSEMAHTTREPYDTLVSYTTKDEAGKNMVQPILFVDTAGIRRKANVSGELEKIGINKSIQSIQTSDIILFVLDGSEPLSSQDKQLGGLLEQRAKSVIIILNKWDLAADKSDKARNTAIATIHADFPFLDFAPVLLVAAESGYRTHDIFPHILHAWTARHTTVSVSDLEYFLRGIIRLHAPSRGKGSRQPSLLGMRQIAKGPPVFEIFVKYRTSVHRSYLNFVENKLRERFDFFATPIIIKLTKMKF